MSDKKKWKLVGLDEALGGLPPVERASVAAEIEEMFRGFDPEHPPGEPVPRVDPGRRDCPKCGGELVELALVPRPDGPDGELILECETCDATYSEPLEKAPS